MDNPISRIDKKASEVRKELARLKDAAQSLEAELLELASARGVLISLGFDPDSEAAATAAASSPYSAMKTKDLILEALSKGPLWQTANTIQETISGWADREIPMSTVSPYLSEMKKDGTIARKGMSVAATLRIEKEEPSFLEENGEAEASPEPDQDSSPGQNSEPSLSGA